jgi:hypothetical protein
MVRTEAGPDSVDTRFTDINVTKSNARPLYEEAYCRRGQAGNHIKASKTNFCADRTSFTKATANQSAQFYTLRLRLIKTAALVVGPKTR